MEPSSSHERLLACYQQALGHDLPNKLVALQGLARLLEEELAGQLSGETSEWLARIVGLTREIDDRVRALAEMGRALQQGGPVTTIDLEETWLEVRSEISFQTNHGILADFCFPVEVVVLPCRSFRRLLAEFFRYAVRRSLPGKDLRTLLSAEALGSDVVLLCFQDNAAPPTAGILEQPFDPRLDDPAGPAAGLGLFLARLLVEGWGGTIRLSAPSEGGCLVAVEIPQPPPPGSAGT